MSTWSSHGVMSVASSSVTPLSAALALTASSASRSRSQAITRAAPASAAAIATTPDPLPISSTVRPCTRSGSASNQAASAWPLPQQKLQYGGASIRALMVSCGRRCIGRVSSSSHSGSVGTSGGACTRSPSSAMRARRAASRSAGAFWFISVILRPLPAPACGRYDGSTPSTASRRLPKGSENNNYAPDATPVSGIAGDQLRRHGRIQAPYLGRQPAGALLRDLPRTLQERSVSAGTLSRRPAEHLLRTAAPRDRRTRYHAFYLHVPDDHAWLRPSALQRHPDRTPVADGSPRRPDDPDPVPD